LGTEAVDGALDAALGEADHGVDEPGEFVGVGKKALAKGRGVGVGKELAEVGSDHVQHSLVYRGALVETGDGGVEVVKAGFEPGEAGEKLLVLLIELVGYGDEACANAVTHRVQFVVELGAADVVGFGFAVEEFLQQDSGVTGGGTEGGPLLGRGDCVHSCSAWGLVFDGWGKAGQPAGGQSEQSRHSVFLTCGLPVTVVEPAAHGGLAGGVGEGGRTKLSEAVFLSQPW
jgi:hypothetical protein